MTPLEIVGEQMDVINKGVKKAFEEYGGEVLTDEEKEAVDNCEHTCTSNCRREGCNCDCGNYHIEK